jgi:hypothetical protein
VKQALWFNGDIYSTKLTGRQTGGQIGLVEATVPPGGGPAPHVHERTDETFYVVKALCAFLRLFSRRPPIILPDASFMLHVRAASRLVCVRRHGRRTFPLAASGTRRIRRQPRRPPGFGVAGNPRLGLAGGLAWGLALM